jgi:hypothetical protein
MHVQAAKVDLSASVQKLEELQRAAMLASEEAVQAESVSKALARARVATSAQAEELVASRAALEAQEVLLRGIQV